MILNWTRCQGGAWCPLNGVNLAEVSTQGVYMIWYEGSPGKVVYVGQGDIAARLTAHRQNPEIQAYSSHGLLVTWATVDAIYRDGVEVFLANQYQPLVGRAYPNAVPIQVNLP